MEPERTLSELIEQAETYGLLTDHEVTDDTVRLELHRLKMELVPRMARIYLLGVIQSYEENRNLC